MEIKKGREGIPSTEEGLKNSEKCWQDMEDCFREIKEKEVPAKKVKNGK